MKDLIDNIKVKPLITPVFSLFVVLGHSLLQASPLPIAEAPLFVGLSVQPNMVMTMDDSGSMTRAYVPETIDSTPEALDGPRFKAARYNGMYYDPTIKYDIPTRTDGIAYSTSFTTAYFNGFDTTRGSVNLSTSYKVVAVSEPVDIYSECSTYITPSNNGSGSCKFAKNPADTTPPPPTAYSVTCNVKFNQRGSNGAKDDRLELQGDCTTRFSGASQPPIGTVITVTGAGARNGSYTVNAVDNGGNTTVTIDQDLAAPDETKSATLAWVVPSQPAAANQNAVPAYYYMYYADYKAIDSSLEKPANCTDNRENDACYRKVEVGSDGSGGKLKDVALGNITDVAAQKQNFAVWYSFYRNRVLTTMSGAMEAVSNLALDSVRMGWQTLSSGSNCDSFGTTCQGYDSVNRENRLRKLTSSHKANFFNWLQRFKLTGSTPLRRAMVRAGEYYKLSGRDSPYAIDPYVTQGTELACRENYHVLFTDGMWNGVDVFTTDTDSAGEIDLPDAENRYTYTPRAPYRDVSVAVTDSYTNEGSLADIALKYWAEDLRTNLDNGVNIKITDNSGNAEAQFWNPLNDPATWQHMVNYTVGLGLTNSLIAACNYNHNTGADPFIPDPNNPTPGCPVWTSTYTGADGFDAIKASSRNWPKVNESGSFNEQPDGHIYDLWHAAVNSRGLFFSADNPTSVKSAFKTILTNISDQNASAAAAAANSTNTQEGAAVYQAQFSPVDWSGHFYAFSLKDDGTLKNTNNDNVINTSDALWDAATRIPVPTLVSGVLTDNRKVFTYNGSTGIPFLWDNLTTAQKTALKTNSLGVVDTSPTANAVAQDRLNWLRGLSAKEQRNGGAGSIFRNRRTTVLGDIINSDPIYTSIEDFGYQKKNLSDPNGLTTEENTSYAAFVTGKTTGTLARLPTVFVGANDGMLHAFRADNDLTRAGTELFAYVPLSVFNKLSSLSEPEYAHQYLVDGSPVVGDAYWSGFWKTVLVSGLRGGGKSIFALDVSIPLNGSFGPSNVLWEYTGNTTCTPTPCDTDANGMGLTFSEPQVARLKDGSWVAIFGNGYNSVAEKAYLYIVNLSTGTLIRRIATNNETSNGLSTITLYDSNGDKITDYAYAGDLQGNMWKFDLTSDTPSAWGVGNGGLPLFTASNGVDRQPITAEPALSKHVDGGVMLYFGTGQYLTTGDIYDSKVQSFYGIWDKPATTGTINKTTELVAQTIDQERLATNTIKFDFRITSNNTVDYSAKRGWYMNLMPVLTEVINPATQVKSIVAGSPRGERVVSPPGVVFDRVIFETVIPSGDPCKSGGSGWLMELDLNSGARTGQSAYDLNGDGKFTDLDLYAEGTTISGLKAPKGMPNEHVWMKTSKSGVAVKQISQSSGDIWTVSNRDEPTPTPGGVVDRINWQQIQ